MHLIPSLLVLLAASTSNAYTLPVPLTCAPNYGVMTTPTYGTTGALFAVCAEITISSPPAPIINALLDFPNYRKWNTFVYAVDLPTGVSDASDVYVGMEMTFHTYGLIPVLNSTSTERVTYIEPGNVPPFVGWREDSGALGDLFMRAEHISALADLGGGQTKYVSWETYYGVGSVVLGIALKENLLKEFTQQAVDLKARVESLG